MKRKDYRKPTMRVVNLHRQCHILASSGVESTRKGYGAAQESTWGDEE